MAIEWSAPSSKHENDLESGTTIDIVCEKSSQYQLITSQGGKLIPKFQARKTLEHGSARRRLSLGIAHQQNIEYRPVNIVVSPLKQLKNAKLVLDKKESTPNCRVNNKIDDLDELNWDGVAPGKDHVKPCIDKGSPPKMNEELNSPQNVECLPYITTNVTANSEACDEVNKSQQNLVVASDGTTVVPSVAEYVHRVNDEDVCEIKITKDCYKSPHLIPTEKEGNSKLLHIDGYVENEIVESANCSQKNECDEMSDVSNVDTCNVTSKTCFSSKDAQPPIIDDTNVAMTALDDFVDVSDSQLCHLYDERIR